MSLSRAILGLAAAFGAAAVLSQAKADVFSITIDGPDAIFLAGRTDLPIPPANQPWGDNDPLTDDGMLRHPGPTPEEALEQLPPSIAVSGGQIVRVLDPAVGGINFFNGFGPLFGPEGNNAGSSITSFGSLSGYIGTQGALAGVFLTAAIPTGSPPPATLDFSTAASRDFSTLSPEIGQIFFIGDGKNSANVFQEFVVPAGATRLFLGIPDAFGFNGVPGAYDDNDGSYKIIVGVDEIPSEVPLPAALPLFAAGLGTIALLARRRKRKIA